MLTSNRFFAYFSKFISLLKKNFWGSVHNEGRKEPSEPLVKHSAYSKESVFTIPSRHLHVQS